MTELHNLLVIIHVINSNVAHKASGGRVDQRDAADRAQVRAAWLTHRDAEPARGGGPQKMSRAQRGNSKADYGRAGRHLYHAT